MNLIKNKNQENIGFIAIFILIRSMLICWYDFIFPAVPPEIIRLLQKSAP